MAVAAVATQPRHPQRRVAQQQKQSGEDDPAMEGVGLAAIDRVGDGPKGRKSAGVRTPGGVGDARWDLPAV